MKSNYRTVIPVLGLLLLVCHPARAQVYTETNRISRSFPLKPATSVEVTNKYGKLHLITWEKDSVKFDVEFTVRTSTPSRLKKIKDNVDIEFTSTDYYITAETAFRSRYYDFLDEIKNLTEAIFPSDNQVTINYTVYLPERVNIKINNKYGDIYAGDLEGYIRIHLSNGDLKVNRLLGQVDLELSQCDARISMLENATCTFNFVEAEITECDRMTLNSLASKITIEKAGDFRLDSRRDDIHLEKAARITGESYFTDYWIGELEKEVNLNLKYGNLNIENIKKQFTNLQLGSDYTDLNLYFEKGSSFQFSLQQQGTTLRFPTGFVIEEEKILDEDKKESLVTGHLGSMKAASRINGNTLKGSLTMILK